MAFCSDYNTEALLDNNPVAAFSRPLTLNFILFLQTLYYLFGCSFR